jgi:hypothetical protein
MRLLSLDFDGVLHPTMQADTVVRTIHFGWLPLLVGVLAPHPDVCVLVHSTWRTQYDVDELRLLLGTLGERVVGAAPPGPRYQSVLEWLRQHPEVTSYRMLDDEAEDFGSPPPAELILCEPSSGVSAPPVLDALRAWLDPDGGPDAQT